MAVTVEKFFETQNAPSQVKSAIVSNYFGAWATIMTKRAGKRVIGYADLFAGRGRFDDGSESTPILAVRKAVNDPMLRTALKTFFNDKNADEVAALEREIGSIAGIEGLAHAPRFHSEAVGPQIVKRLAEFRSIPTLLFADPFGYMGISLELINGNRLHGNAGRLRVQVQQPEREVDLRVRQFLQRLSRGPADAAAFTMNS